MKTMHLKQIVCLCLILLIVGCSDKKSKSKVSDNKDATKAYRQGVKAFDEGKWRTAMVAFKQTVKLDSECIDAYLYLGDSYLHLDENKANEHHLYGQAAISAYKRVIQLNSDLARGHFGLGLSYFGIEKHHDAIDSLSRALKIDPEYTEAYTALAAAYISVKRPADALVACDKALKLQEENPELYYLKGCILGQLGRQDDAIAAFHKAVELDPAYGQEPYGMDAMYESWKNRP